MRAVWEMTKAKLRLRGRGSGYYEGSQQTGGRANTLKRAERSDGWMDADLSPPLSLIVCVCVCVCRVPRAAASVHQLQNL